MLHELPELLVDFHRSNSVIIAGNSMEVPMHLGIPALLDFYRKHSDEEAFVLATIIATSGSTYRKPGAMMLISRGGAYEGMISGGCLEGDLLHHAAKVFASGNPSHITYDMHADDELVWNLGLGCDGVIHLLLRRLDRDNGFVFLAQLEQSFRQRKPCLIALVTQSSQVSVIGAVALLDKTDISAGDARLVDTLREVTGEWPGWRSRLRTVHADGDEHTVLLVHVPAQPRVLICGAGPDAAPLARLLADLDWQVHLVDHRPAYLQSGDFPDQCALIESRPANLGEKAELHGYDAAVIMSHHLENDAEYLRQLAGRDIPYLGLLGPAARRSRLKEMADCKEQLLYGPAGLDIGAELPTAIALSIAAEIHAVLNGREGMPLLHKADAA
jgi:xanthine dehydrogenase accessory factor